MPEYDLFLDLAEVAIVFAGFSGISAVLSKRGPGGWSDIDAARIATMVENSLVFALLALFNPIVFLTDVDDFLMSNASGWIDGADNTLTFDDAGDACSFEALGTGAATDWRLVSKKGVALSTV